MRPTRYSAARRRTPSSMQELRFHLEEQIAENRRGRHERDEARQAALRLFGNPTVLREQARETWSWQWLESLARDTRHGARRLMRTPSFALYCHPGYGAGHRREHRAVYRRQCGATQASARRTSKIAWCVSMRRAATAVSGQRRRRRMLRALAERGAQLCPDGHQAGTRLTTWRALPARCRRWSTQKRLRGQLLSMLGVHPAIGRLFHRR